MTPLALGVRLPPAEGAESAHAPILAVPEGYGDPEDEGEWEEEDDEDDEWGDDEEEDESEETWQVAQRASA